MNQALLFLYTDGLVHAGGSSSRGVVDLPIQREVTTGLPVIWGQSLKGAIREDVERSGDFSPDEVAGIFGDPPPEGSGGQLRPGSVSIGDARLVAFPVPTTQRTFAWCTSPIVLGRLARLSALTGVALVTQGGSGPEDQAYASGPGWGGKTGFGDYTLTVQAQQAWVAGLAENLATMAVPAVAAGFAEKLKRDLVVVDGAVFSDLTRDFVEIFHRIRLEDDKKNVARGGLWVEEHLPAETILVSHLVATHAEGSDEQLLRLHDFMDGRVIRVGGDETVGKGLVWCRTAVAEQGSGHVAA